MSVTIPPPTPVPTPGYWPMPPPGTLPGCGPPQGSLMDCYWSIQSATAFISAIMIDAINNNPAVAQAMIEAIEKSGSTLPLIGVTDGSNAQPGQVGEFFWNEQVNNYPTTSQTLQVASGVLSPGDWDCWATLNTSSVVNDVSLILNPVPTGFSGNMNTLSWAPASADVTLNAPATRASITVPTLVNFTVTTNHNANGPVAGQVFLIFSARRRR